LPNFLLEDTDEKVKKPRTAAHQRALEARGLVAPQTSSAASGDLVDSGVGNDNRDGTGEDNGGWSGTGEDNGSWGGTGEGNGGWGENGEGNTSRWDGSGGDNTSGWGDNNGEAGNGGMKW
jgi:hypothetical protein